MFLKLFKELLTNGDEGDDDSDGDFGDGGNTEDGENNRRGLLVGPPKVGLKILSMENGKTRCSGFNK